MQRMPTASNFGGSQMADKDKIDFEAFVNAVREVKLDDQQVHDAAHSMAVSSRTWQQISEKENAELQAKKPE